MIRGVNFKQPDRLCRAEDMLLKSVSTLRSCQQLHQEAPERELYVFHTGREALDVTQRRWVGVRETRGRYSPKD